MRYAPLAGVRTERNICPKSHKMTDVAEWWVSISGYEHVEHKCLECGHRWPNFVEGDHPDLFRALQEAGLRRSKKKKIVTYEDRLVTRRWAICDICGHSVLAVDVLAWWGSKCAVCGKEGCPECMDHDSFWADHKEYYHHKACKLTKALQKFKDEYER